MPYGTAALARPVKLERFNRFLATLPPHAFGDAIPVTQEFLGQVLGVRRTTVTAAARVLQSAGLIRYRRGHLQIVNRPALEETACECYAVVKHKSDKIFPPSENVSRGAASSNIQKSSSCLSQGLPAYPQQREMG
jgi:hypothetical protein